MNCVISPCQHTVSMQKCHRRERAADLARFPPSAIKAAVLRRSSTAVRLRWREGKKGKERKGVERWAPPGRPPSDTDTYESQQRCQQCDQHASRRCLAYAPRQATLSVHTHTHTHSQPGEYIKHRPRSDLARHFSPWTAHFRACQIQVLHTEFWGGGRL